MIYMYIYIYIGFHLYEYARHFLTNCHRILGYKSETNAAGILTIYVDGREVAIICIHVGTDMPYIQQVYIHIYKQSKQ
jgi:trehalose 6-phosphate synthase/phosphatase